MFTFLYFYKEDLLLLFCIKFNKFFVVLRSINPAGQLINKRSVKTYSSSLKSRSSIKSESSPFFFSVKVTLLYVEIDICKIDRK